MRHFHEELAELRKQISVMAGHVQESIQKAVEALLLGDKQAAGEVFKKEEIINRLEIEIDDKAYSLFALGQPMAGDLRLIASILKVNSDLERLGDHGVNIAERALALAGERPFEIDLQLPQMTAAVRKMLKDALHAFTQNNMKLAQEVLESDDVVDTYNDSLYARLEEHLQKDPALIKTGMKLARIGHDLERIADLANNIAEDTFYLHAGKEVRHRFEIKL